MWRTIRARPHTKPRIGAQASPAEKDPLIAAWWASVLAGDTDEPHPVYGAAVKVNLDRTRLRLSGELESREDRDDLVREARRRIGHGIGSVDVSGLTVAKRREKPGILDQTLISAFPSRAAAEYARDFVIKHSRVKPRRHDVVDADTAAELRTLLNEEFERDACKAIDEGLAVLVLRVDETGAFRVRELIDEDTRSLWTIAMPPELSAGGGARSA